MLWSTHWISYALRSSTDGRLQPMNGSKIRTPAFTKSARFRVTTVRPWTTAVAAMRAILDRHRLPGGAKTRQKFRPLQTRFRVPGQTVETPGSRIEPVFQGSPLPSLGKDQNPESQLAKYDRIDGDVRLMSAKPRHDARVGRRFGRLAQNIGVDQIFHIESVDSESTGAK